MTKTMINLKTAQQYLNAETEVIHEIRCLLQNDQIEDMLYRTSSYTFSLSSEGNILKAEIMDPPEILLIEITDGKVFDYTVERYGIETEE